MAKKWWRVTAAVEADTVSSALNTLRRVGTMPESVDEINELGRIQFETPVEMPSPWKPRETAPRTGKEFIGYDARIGHAETARWDQDVNGFVNLDHNPTDFTQWTERPALLEDHEDESTGRRL
jgi:hypothetical protein